MTAEKLLLVMSKNSQHRRIVCLSQPDVACSFMDVISRFCSWKSQNCKSVLNSRGCVRRRVNHAVAPILIAESKKGEEGVSGREYRSSRSRRLIILIFFLRSRTMTFDGAATRSTCILRKHTDEQGCILRPTLFFTLHYKYWNRIGIMDSITVYKPAVSTY